MLPAASRRHLPAPFQALMTERASPILDFYPTDFSIDMEGKRADWEGVVHVPFIDEARLLAAAASVKEGALSAEERRRNAPGEVLAFTHSPGIAGEADYCGTSLPSHFPDVLHAHSRCAAVPPPPPLPPGERGFRPALAEGTQTGVYNPRGFPTLKTMQSDITGAELRPAGINIFGTASKKDSLVLSMRGVPPSAGGGMAAAVAGQALGQKVYIRWPYLQARARARRRRSRAVCWAGEG